MKKFITLLLIALFIIRFLNSTPVFKENQKIRISSQVTSEPSVNFGKQTFRLVGLKVSLPSFPEIHYGDYAIVEGVVKGEELTNAKLNDLKVSNNIFISLRKKLISIYNQALPKPHSGLITGIVIGAKSDLGDFYNKLINTGTSHVVVASGANITMFSTFVLSVSLYFVKRKRALIVTLVCILIYCFITGFEAPIVRAALMSSLVLIAQFFGRLVSPQRILFLTGAFMIFIRPDWLRDIGFILSFATTLSMMLFEIKINRLIHFIPDIFRESLSTSLSAQLIASPIIFFSFGRINFLSPLINALVLWTIAPIMIIGALGGLISLILEPLGKLVLLLIYPLTWWFITTIQIFG